MNRFLHCKSISVLVLIVFHLSCISQEEDHPKAQSTRYKEDSILAERAIYKIDSIYDCEDFSQASLLIDKTIPLCEKLNFPEQLARLYKTKGDIYISNDNYIKALEALSTSLEYYKKLNDRKGIADIKNSIGTAYRFQGKYPTALEYYFESLKINQSISYKQGISGALNNIGIVYLYQKDFDKALEYYFNSLKIGEELNDEEGIGVSYLNIGGAYQKKKEYDKAIDYYLKSLAISKKLNNLDAIGVNYNEIGSIYMEQNNLQLAKSFLLEALKTFVKLGSKSRQTESYLYLGQYFFIDKNPEQSILHFTKALNLAKETGSKEYCSNALLKLSEVCESINNSKSALKYYKEFISIRDSIFNEENTKQSVQAELLYQFERRQEIFKVLQVKKDDIFLEKVKRQKIFRNLLILILVLLTVLIVFIYSALRNKKKANIILAIQQNEILEKNEELMQQQEEIRTQRDEIEKKNVILENSKQIIAAKSERIISSIEYALTIQQAILPKEEQLSELFKDQFVIFLPKDIVSGDFFWISSVQNLVFAAVIDCTGHGVPGSFMSLIGNTILNQIVNEWHTHDPSLILEYLHQKIRKSLQQDESHSKSHASMDVCLIKINRNTSRVTFAGANRSLLIIQDGKLERIQGDRKSVGGFQRESRRYYTNHEINLSNNSCLYLATDGFIDQMNSEKRKFGQKQFSDLLVENCDKPMSVQKEIILNMLDKYRGDEEQIDDICILGLKM
ncbi:MAG: tetratricopeptide repeat protein [Bacteroidales bacterium]|nr:tetratricopeptide repeat protein [Bacteroidales bacterium]